MHFDLYANYKSWKYYVPVGIHDEYHRKTNIHLYKPYRRRTVDRISNAIKGRPHFKVARPFTKLAQMSIVYQNHTTVDRILAQPSMGHQIRSTINCISNSLNGRLYIIPAQRSTVYQTYAKVDSIKLAQWATVYQTLSVNDRISNLLNVRRIPNSFSDRQMLPI